MDELDLKIKKILEEDKEVHEEAVPSHLVEQAKRLMPAGPVKPPPAGRRFWSFLWLAGPLVSFALSFVFAKFFLQFLVLTFLLGLKWILDQRAARTQIMIYKALEADKADETKAPGTNRLEPKRETHQD